MHDVITNGLPSQNLGQTQARGALKFGQIKYWEINKHDKACSCWQFFH